MITQSQSVDDWIAETEGIESRNLGPVKVGKTDYSWSKWVVAFLLKPIISNGCGVAVTCWER